MKLSPAPYHDPTKPGKPAKSLYADQNEVKKKVIEFLRPYLKRKPFFKRVWIWGSLSKGTFGVYHQPYRGHEGSDIDLLVEVDEKHPVPNELKEIKEWAKTRDYSRAFTSSLFFENPLPNGKARHEAQFICHFPSKHTKKRFYSKVAEAELIHESA